MTSTVQTPTALAPAGLGRVRDLFTSDVTRDIPPVVYFHEQSPQKLADEVSEYIITGGWPEGHPNHRRVPNGIHEQAVRLLRAICDELDKKGGPELPNIWISGFYGSGKSSFAKLIGLALDGAALPDGRALSAALLARDTSPRADELRAAWAALRHKLDPVAVVFDIGAVARDGEHIHAAAVRQVQARLGYCPVSAQVAYAELNIERDGHWPRFLDLCQRTFGQPWSAFLGERMVQARFSRLMHLLHPDVFIDEADWDMRHAGTAVQSLSPAEATAAIGDMLQHRRPSATLFMVIDEVSQYVLANHDRVERLRAFAEALGARQSGRVWLLALGQQKLEEDADDSFLVKTKDRFPQRLRVHLNPTNIRDVVHKRLLQKRPEVEPALRALFEAHRPELQLYAYGCDAVTPDELVETYPMLPGQIDLLLQITSELRTRSSRAQGDDQAIRGLLQLLGELFRDQGLANLPAGALVTLEHVYEVQHTALDSDTQASMARVLAHCADDATGLLARVAKVVALLALIQDKQATDARLVAQALYDRLDRGNQLGPVTQALEELRRRNLLGYSEKHGYKLQSSAGEEWERERRDLPVGRDDVSTVVIDALRLLLAAPDKPRLDGRAFSWAGRFGDGRRHDDTPLGNTRDEAALTVDLRLLAGEDAAEATWIRRSADEALRDRILWVCGEIDALDTIARERLRSEAMVRRYGPLAESMSPARAMLLQQERARAEDLRRDVDKAVAACWMAGALFFRGRAVAPRAHGAAFATALSAFGARVLPELYPHFVPTTVAPSELAQLLEATLSGPSPKFLRDELGLLDLDNGRYVPTCDGIVPRRVAERVSKDGALSGTALLAAFGGPPFGYAPELVKACVAGLLRAGALRIQPEAGAEITAIRDVGVKDLFEKDRAFRRATFSVAGDDDIGVQARARICKLFETELQHRMDREDHLIADAVSQLFPPLARRLREVLHRHDQLPGRPAAPPTLTRLHDVLEECVAKSRQTRPTVTLLKRHLDPLRDGLRQLQLIDAELTPAAVSALRAADEVQHHHLAQLEAAGRAGPVEASGARLRAQLAAPSPWREIGALQADLDAIRAAYTEERRALLREQEAQAEAARARVRAREGFATLSADASHQVLAPITQARTATTPEAVAPALIALRDPFTLALQRAEAAAIERLEALRQDKNIVVKVDLGLQHREIKSEAEIEALLAEIGARLRQQLAAGARVRLV